VIFGEVCTIAHFSIIGTENITGNKKNTLCIKNICETNCLNKKKKSFKTKEQLKI
jgi:hypothetical protein